MVLSFSEIKSITLGAAGVEQHEDGVHFYRFTKEQQALYKIRNDDFYRKTFATSGVKLRFVTDSETLSLTVNVSGGSSRRYFATDVFVNGKKLDSLDNFSGVALPADYTTFPLAIGGEYSKTFSLGTGEKEVAVYFPWSAETVLKELALDDNAFVKPKKPGEKLVCFGDSITQGYDALYPSNSYVSKLADMMDVEVYNKAIGGETFFPELAAAKEDFEPAYITVAYGTNDWSHISQEEFVQNCSAFFKNLCRTYPHAKIFAIAPIWRKDMFAEKLFGDFADVEKCIREAAAFDNVTVINGFSFVPQDENLYADLRLHPNDEGFSYYFESLAKAIRAER